MTLAIILTTYILPFLSARLRSNGAMMLAYFLSVTAHHAAAVLNNHFFSLAGSTQDAEGFHMAASRLLVGQEHYYQRHFYTKLLSKLYEFSGADKLLGSELSILAFSLTLVVIAQLMHDLAITKRAALILAAIGLTPSPLIHTSVTLREPFQMLLLSILVLIVSRIWHGKHLYLLPLLPVAAILSRFHNGLSVLAGLSILVAGAGPFRAWIRKQFLIASILTVISVSGLMVVAATLDLLNESAALEAVTTGGVSDYAAYYREHQPDARTNYNAPHNFSNPVSSAASIPVLFAYYMMAPFPWQIGDIKDIYTFAENSFRVLLLWSSITYFRRLQGDAKVTAGIILGTFLVLECLWSIGTANWGNALRHHSISLWMVMLLGIPQKPQQAGVKPKDKPRRRRSTSLRSNVRARRQRTGRRATREQRGSAQ